ncbi:DNA replication ATP-dependent helicase/nuclease Dna2 [Microdochium nivale]|nr:DNA replication ATP-dependent helicase/nuclease Dna2 [Microdochium nivale]
MPLQKSFSEQNGPVKSRQNWSRSKAHTYGGAQSTASRSTSNTRPLEPVSAVTKNKLNAFSFNAPAIDSAGDNTKHTGEPISLGMERKEDKTMSEAGNAGRNKVASTPMSRLAWQDLIGMPEIKETDEDASPQERLSWDARQGPQVSYSPIVPRRRNRKRARSSSPTSSPVSSSKVTTPAVSVKQLSRALKSPHADPAMELWDRFSLSGSHAITPTGAKNHALAQLMVSSSPQPRQTSRSNHTAVGESNLRRALSCGTNWPKRRRLDRQESARSADGALEGSPTGSAKTTMVNALLRNMTGELNRSQTIMAPPGPVKSPTARRSTRAAVMDVEQSPSRKSKTRESSELTAYEVQPEPTTPHVAEQSKTSNNFDFDDDDFDDFDDFDNDTLLELDNTLSANQQSTKTNNPEVTPSHGNRSTNTINDLDMNISDDEFADMDDDVFAAAETLVSQLDGGQAANNAVPQEDQAGDDDYGDDLGVDFDFDAAELAATQSVQQAGRSVPLASNKPKTIQRYLVSKVVETEYTNDDGRENVEKILFVQLDRSNVMKSIHLRDDWVDTPASQGAYVHVIGGFEASGQCIIDNSQNVLILHPDQLMSATVIADSFTCMRRAVLQDRVKATSEKTPPLVYGTLIHEIFQQALVANQWDDTYLDDVIQKVTELHVEDLYTIRIAIPDAREHLRSKMPELKSWASAFVTATPRPDAVVQGRNGEKANMALTRLLDVEEHVWSPLYGMKGNIDATVEVIMQDGKQRRTLTVPFEVKTGRNATSNHQAQTSLYNLLLSDRYDIEIAYGILYYTETSQMTRIPTIRHELRHMIMQRNQLACYVRERNVQLPPMKKSSHACSKCYAQTSCFIYHKLADDGDGETSGLKAKFDEAMDHLNPTHQDFFLKWEDLLTKEERESQKLRRELWTMTSREREKVGRCFGDVILDESSVREDEQSSKINRFTYSFVKDEAAPGFSFLESQLAVGEPIVVSDEQGHFALAIGYVTAVRKHKISVAVDRRLHNARTRQPGFDEVNNQVFASIMDVAPRKAVPAHPMQAPIRYRVDKDEFSNGMATVRNNLVQVMAKSLFGSKEIRRLVVDLIPPTFKTAPTQYALEGRASLNVDQRRAIQKVMSANDYALVLGMPGTGKTTTIAHIIRALVSQKKSVLLTSYTHSAVDNILLKLKNDDIPVLRLGAIAKVHPEVQDFVILASQPKDSFEDIRSAWHDTPIVATTCLGVNHPLFSERTFDYCIVDEASQITLPICLGPIRMAKTFVLVGDHNQLPPLVQNEEARAGGLDISLFKLLSDTHPSSVVNLEHQYRMCEDIMSLSNALIYEGHLKCGTEALRFQKLDVPNMDALKHKHYDETNISYAGSARSICTSWTTNSCWLRSLLDPEARVRFVNTDYLPSNREEAKGNRIVNPTEAQIVVQLVDSLVAVGVPAGEIGVMTHYRSQLSLLKHGLRNYGNKIELHTADRFQGRDKEVVILSLVRSNEACSIGDLLKDWRRINVAFTRAKTKLLVVGSRQTLKGSGEQEMLSRFIKLMETKDWIYDLDADALDRHFFEDGMTQLTSTAAGTQARNKEITPRKHQPLENKIGRRKDWAVGDKENQKSHQDTGPRRGTVTAKALVQGRPILGNILVDLMDDDDIF